jgi:hypothetical protein
MGGVLVHISKYRERIKGIDKDGIVGSVRIFDPPPNERERDNDPRLKKKADYILAWKEEIGTPAQVKKKLTPHVLRFIKWLRKYYAE